MSIVQVNEHTFRLPVRARQAHKGDFGRVYVLGGSVGYTGAPVFAANAAVRTGSGLVFLGVPEAIWSVVAVKCNEAMPHPLDEDKNKVYERISACDAALIGPGLGQSDRAWGLVHDLVSRLEIPLVLDADGLNVLQGRTGLLTGRTAPTVITPHEGEFARLTGQPLPVSDRIGAARAFAEEYGCVVVLKGYQTVTAAPDGRVWVNTSGNPGMAKGGSGDVLAGMILSLIGQGFPAAESAAMAVWLHGRAGDFAAGELGEYAMTPTELLDFLPRALMELSE
ncbi:MAG: NAD(P)H-hydrate dehydratase [Ruminococcaceae bacterium]|nr:NAD(P)H-hydrate dehydratase [Oscillospiraceae bacterium]